MENAFLILLLSKKLKAQGLLYSMENEELKKAWEELIIKKAKEKAKKLEEERAKKGKREEKKLDKSKDKEDKKDKESAREKEEKKAGRTDQEKEQEKEQDKGAIEQDKSEEEERQNRHEEKEEWGGKIRFSEGGAESEFVVPILEKKETAQRRPELETIAEQAPMPKKKEQTIKYEKATYSKEYEEKIIDFKDISKSQDGIGRFLTKIKPPRISLEMENQKVASIEPSMSETMKVPEMSFKVEYDYYKYKESEKKDIEKIKRYEKE